MKGKKFIIGTAIILLIITAITLVAKIALEKVYGDEKSELSKGNWYKIARLLGSEGKSGVWQYNPKITEINEYIANYSPNSLTSYFDVSAVSGGRAMSSSSARVVSEKATSSVSSDSYIGYSVGGANNINNFRENIKNGYLPISTDITYNGIYSEYFFNTGNVDRSSNEMFYPSYSMAVSKNPITGETEYYMSVGLNSNIRKEDFIRKKLNLVVVLDISGSMSSSFSSYYYDGKKKVTSEETERKSKMKIAEECINDLIDQLKPEDRLGIVLFDDSAYLGCEIVEIGSTDTEDLKKHILEVKPNGGTNFSAGYEKATELFNDVNMNSEYQNRIIVITDAMPNLGITSMDGMTQKIQENSKNKIYTSFVGVGVDFNTKYTEGVSDVRGFNYYSVHSSKEFKKILADEFDYMVTPLVYDLDFSFKSGGYAIENIYGSDSVSKSTGNIMHVNTLFPSSSNEEGEVKGGIIVLKLKKVKEDANANSNEIELAVSYTDVDEKKHECSKRITFKESKEDYYENDGIRKAIVLARYVGTMKNWVAYERTHKVEFEAEDNAKITDYDYDNKYVKKLLGENERASTKLTVDQSYKQVFKKLKEYVESENIVLNDNDMQKEIEILELLV